MPQLYPMCVAISAQKGGDENTSFKGGIFLPLKALFTWALASTYDASAFAK